MISVKIFSFKLLVLAFLSSVSSYAQRPDFLLSKFRAGDIVVVKAGEGENALEFGPYASFPNQYGIQYMKNKEGKDTRIGLDVIAKHRKALLARTLKDYCDVIIERINTKSEPIFTEDLELTIKSIHIHPNSAGHYVEISLKNSNLNSSFQAKALSLYLPSAASKDPSMISMSDLEKAFGRNIILQKSMENFSTENPIRVK